MTTTTSIDWDAAGAETIAHLQAIIRFDTSNPPGNETDAARYIADAARAEGIEAEIVESAPGRGAWSPDCDLHGQPPARSFDGAHRCRRR